MKRGTKHAASSEFSSMNSYGQIQLSIRAVNEVTISIHVVKAIGLRSSLPLANAFCTIGLLPVPAGAAVKNPQTSTVVCSNSPSFNELLNLDITKRCNKSRLFVAVWNKLPEKKPAELTGAMSFSLKQCLTEPFSGWYHLLEESLAMNKHLRTESPEEPLHLRTSRISEERLYENTTEQHYKQPRKLHASVYSESKMRTRRSSSLRKPAPRSRPPPIPGSVSSNNSELMHDRGYGYIAGAEEQLAADVQYKVPSKSLYKRPIHPEGRARPVKVRSREDMSMNLKELARFSQPTKSSSHRSTQSQTSTHSHASTCSSSRTSSMERLSSEQGSTQTLDRVSSNKESTHYMDTTIVSRPTQCKHAAVRLVKRQALFRPSLALSPDSSLSSSDSMAAWTRLNSDGTKFVPYLLHIPRGSDGFGFSITDDTPVAVCHVDEGSDAEKAGLRVNDRLIEVQGEDLSNAASSQVAAIIRHQTKLMKLVVWRPVTNNDIPKQQKMDTRSVLTPVKRSGSKVSSSTVASKKHRQHKEKKNKRKRDGVADGVSMHEQPNNIHCLKALDMVTYLYEQEVEFCDVMKKSYRYHANELQLSGKVGETETYVLFQNIDMLINMSQYFAGKLEIVVRQANDGKRMISTAPEIYSPRVELIKQNYIKYIEGIEEAEKLKILLNVDDNVPANQKGVLSLDEFLHNPLHHIQKVVAAFNVLLQNIENSSVNLPHVQKICSELQQCIERVDRSAKVNATRSTASDQPQAVQADPELLEIQEKLEFLPHVTRVDLCHGSRHRLYWSEVNISGVKHKMMAYLFSDMILIAKVLGGRDRKLLVERDPVHLSDVIDVEYGSTGNECSLSLHYMSASNQRLCQLSIVYADIETKLVWKGLLRDRLVQHRTAELNYSDQGIQVSESSECADGEELCCDVQELSLPTKGRAGDGLSDSMTAIADDLCSSNQLRTSSSGETTVECLQLADYTKHEAKQAMTVAVNNNNNNSIAAGQKHVNGMEDRSADGLADGDGVASNAFISIRTPPIDLSAITEEGDDLANTSMYLSCSHEATPSECASTPIDKSLSSHSRQCQVAGSYCVAQSPMLNDSDLDSAGGIHLLQVSSNSRQQRSFSNPELFSDELNSRSMSGYGEDMCTPTSSQKPSDMSAPPTETSESTSHSHSRLLIKRKSLSDDNIGNCTFDSQRCALLPCYPAKASFTLGDSPPSSPPSTPCSPSATTDWTTSSSRLSFVLPHVESDAKLSTKSPAQRKSLSNKIRRSKSYTNTGLSTTPSHARFLQQQMTQLSVDQNSGKTDGRQRKFSSVAKNVRNVLHFFKRRTSEANAPIPSLEVVESWSQNFSNLLNDKYGLMLFRSFLLSEYSEENIEFWIACEEYKKLKARQHPQKAQSIYSDFVTVHAPKEVNLDSKTRMETMKALANPTVVTFDLAQSRIQCLMEKDSYTRFLKSSSYTTVLTQARANSSTMTE